MRASWADQRDQQEWDAGLLTGQSDPSRTERERDHDDQLEAADRAADRLPHGLTHLAYTERPSDRERTYWRERADENRARALLHPHTGHVTPAPQITPCTCGHPRLGPGPAHMYRCARYAKHPRQEAA